MPNQYEPQDALLDYNTYPFKKPSRRRKPSKRKPMYPPKAMTFKRFIEVIAQQIARRLFIEEKVERGTIRRHVAKARRSTTKR